MNFTFESWYSLIMVKENSSKEALFARLRDVNTDLNAIEQGWPHRQPSEKKSTFTADNCSRASKAARLAASTCGTRLIQAFPKGWEFEVFVVIEGPPQAMAMLEIFINGSGFASVRFFAGDEKGLKTKADCMRACVEHFDELTTNVINRLSKYPHAVFASQEYKKLCNERRELNARWSALNLPYNEPYPYGVNVPGWPVFEGMQLGT